MSSVISAAPPTGRTSSEAVAELPFANGAHAPRRGLLDRTLGALGGAGAIFIVLPFILTGLWYLVCASIVARIPLP